MACPLCTSICSLLFDENSFVNESIIMYYYDSWSAEQLTLWKSAATQRYGTYFRNQIFVVIGSFIKNVMYF
jgi:hypothetical protein